MIVTRVLYLVLISQSQYSHVNAMKVKRQKTNKRHMAVYQTSFGFRIPYQVLVDGEFVQAGLQYTIHIKEQLPKVMMGNTKQMVTECTMSELRSLGDDYVGAALAAKRFERRRCKHKNPVPSAQCISEIIAADNPHNYCVATQDTRLRDSLRLVPGVPLLYINRSVLILEPPSYVTVERAKEIERQKTLPTKKEITFLTKSNSDTIKKLAEKAEAKLQKKKRKGPKEPNPLSVKKKKKPAPVAGSAAVGKSKEESGKENAEENSANNDAVQKRKRKNEDVEMVEARDGGVASGDTDPMPAAKRPRKRKKRAEKATSEEVVTGARNQEDEGN